MTERMTSPEQRSESVHPSEPVDKPTGQQLEAVFFAALRARDMEGVVAALRVMATVDPTRAARLYDQLQTSLGIAKAVHGG